MPSPEPPGLSDCYLVFSTTGDLCRVHVGPEAEFTAASHASVISGFTVKMPVHEDFRDYDR